MKQLDLSVLDELHLGSSFTLQNSSNVALPFTMHFVSKKSQPLFFPNLKSPPE